MENRKDNASAPRQQGLQQTTPARLNPQAQQSQQQPGQQQQSTPYEPKLVRDPKTGDYYDQNLSKQPQAPQAAPAQRQQQQGNTIPRDPQTGEFQRQVQGSKPTQRQAK